MKVLLISHNCISRNTNMGKTFLSLFSEFDKAEICQLYIYPSVPDVDICSSYYRVTDKEVLKSFYTFKAPGSEIDHTVISENEGRLFENEKDEKLYSKGKGNSPVKRLLRDMMWSLSRWYTKELEAWLDREAPTAIFLSPGYAKFIYDIAFRISKKREIPIITYICDDYYFVETPSSLVGKIQLSLLRKKIDRLMQRSKHLVTICEEIKDAYSEKFSVPTTVVMTGTNYLVSNEIKVSEKPKNICYFGNIGCNRYISLSDIGRSLDRLNSLKNTDYMLKIYTSERNTDILSSFDKISSARLCGFVSGKDFDDAFNKADILLHTEAFDKESIDLVKHSVSTKIADSLASGKAFFAYGPESVASMRHLIRHGCAVTSTSAETLDEKLSELFENSEKSSQAAEKALVCASQYHDSRKNSEKIKNIFLRMM